MAHPFAPMPELGAFFNGAESVCANDAPMKILQWRKPNKGSVLWLILAHRFPVARWICARQTRNSAFFRVISTVR
jgi:hypothetical protein